MINLLSYRRVGFMKICFYASKAVNENKTRIYPEGSSYSKPGHLSYCPISTNLSEIKV